MAGICGHLGGNPIQLVMGSYEDENFTIMYFSFRAKCCLKNELKGQGKAAASLLPSGEPKDPGAAVPALDS